MRDLMDPLQQAILQQTRPAQQNVTVAAPMNDVQLVALLAAQFNLPAKDAVERARKLIVETVVQLQNDALGNAIKYRIEKGS